MPFSGGFWDELFGERLTLQVPGPSGVRQVHVTRKWLKQMEATKQIQRALPEGTQITVNVLSGPSFKLDEENPEFSSGGSARELWTVGKEVAREQAEQHFDVATDSLYALRVYNAGVPKTVVCPRQYWEQAKAAMP